MMKALIELTPKEILMKLLTIFALSFFSLAALAQTTWQVDPSNSKVEWLGKKVTGQHNGTIAIKSGNLKMEKDLLTGGEILVDMNTMQVEDIKDTEMAGKFLGHMKSPDFFDTTQHPEARLVILSSKKSSKGLEVKGEMTMKGKTQPVTFLAVVDKKGNDTLLGKSDLALNRTKWDIKYGSGLIGTAADKIIYDDFNLKILISAKK
jgi:polyisoprenoid-binding protein YceI